MKERIKELRKALKKTQGDFGAAIGAADSTVGNWEKGRQRPPASAILSICRVFNVSKDWLENGRGDMFAAAAQSNNVGACLKPDGMVMAAGGEIFKRLPPDLQEVYLRFLHRLVDNGGDLLDAMAEFPDDLFFNGSLLSHMRESERAARSVDNDGAAENIGVIRNNSGTVNQNIKIQK